MNEKEKLKNYEEALAQIALEFNERKLYLLTAREIRIGECLAELGFLNIDRALGLYPTKFVIPENKEN